MSELELQDAILRHALELQRLSASDEAIAIQIMAELEAELRQLLASGTLTDAGKREVEALIKSAGQVIDTRYSEIAKVVDVRGLVLIVAERTVEALEGIIPSIAMPTRETLESLSKDIMIDGAPSSAWWDRQAEDTTFRFAREVRQGVLEGQTNEQIVQRVVGFDGEPGLLDTSRRNVRTLVHSSIMTAANQARLATYRKNSKHAKGVRWLSTLDTRTCAQCAALDGQSWDFDGKKLDGSTVEFMAPPAHFSCRCVLTPIAKGLDDIFGTSGLDAKMQSPVRASKDGPVANTTFDAFLRRQSKGFVEEMLGVGRAELFREGKLTLRDLVSGTGRELTLAELRTR